MGELAQHEDAVARGEDFFVNMTRKAPFVGPTMATSIQEWGKTPEQRAILSQIEGVRSNYRKTYYGASLTEGEQAEFGRLDPLAEGTSAQESLQRLNSMKKRLENDLTPYMSGGSTPAQPRQPTPSEKRKVWRIDENGNPVRTQ